MKNQIKIRKAQKSLGYVPTASAHILNNIPESVLNSLTSKQISELMVAMNKHFNDGKVYAEKEIHGFIGLPESVNVWDVIGDDDYHGIGKFSDGLNLANIMESRGQEVIRFESEYSK